MRNKYNYGELVKISGMGKNFGEVKNRLGFIIRNDEKLFSVIIPAFPGAFC